MRYAKQALPLHFWLGFQSLHSTSAASAQNMSKRDAAITQCIQEAHAQYPYDYQGVGQNRTYVYRSLHVVGCTSVPVATEVLN